MACRFKVGQLIKYGYNTDNSKASIALVTKVEPRKKYTKESFLYYVELQVIKGKGILPFFWETSSVDKNSVIISEPTSATLVLFANPENKKEP